MKNRFIGQALKDKIRRYLILEAGGVLRWRELTGPLSRSEKRHNTLFAGKEAGVICKTNGYRIVTLGKISFKAHVIVFFLHTGEVSETLLDHKDGIKSNNDPSNLRQGTPSKNAQNSKISAKNRSGVRGVSFHTKTGKWKVRVTAEGREKFGGWFANLEEARVVAENLRKEMHEEFYRE